jgi:uncharacterized protein YlxW (UPF0749 family)
MDQTPLVLQIAVFVILGVAGVAYLVSIVRRESTKETRELAKTRAGRIDDLEKEVARLRDKVENLQGALEAYQRIKAEEIAIEVARLLEPRLPHRDDL